MKLFIDTSNKKLVLAIINEENIIVDFSMKDSNNDMVKNTLPLIEKFIKKNKLQFEDFNDYMLTTGPGSYTGVKVAINIIRSINLVNEINALHVINTFDLITNNKTKYTALKAGKNKFYLRNNKLKKTKSVETIDEKIKESLTMDYDSFNKELLQEKISNNSFKVLDNINKVKINYINKF